MCLITDSHFYPQFTTKKGFITKFCLMIHSQRQVSSKGHWYGVRLSCEYKGHRDSKGPCPLPGLMKNRQVDMTKIKSLLQKRQTSLCPGHEWLAIVVLWFHWRVHSCNGHFHFWTKKQCKKWFGSRVGLVLSRVHKLSYAKKKFFLFLKLLLWKISH